MGIELFSGCHMRGEPRALAARTDLLAGGPKSMDSTRFSIVAKIANFGPASPQQVDPDDFQVMLRALLDVWTSFTPCGLRGGLWTSGGFQMCRMSKVSGKAL